MFTYCVPIGCTGLLLCFVALIGILIETLFGAPIQDVLKLAKYCRMNPFILQTYHHKEKGAYSVNDYKRDASILLPMIRTIADMARDYGLESKDILEFDKLSKELESVVEDNEDEEN